jgi:hypothetical protein
MGHASRQSTGRQQMRQVLAGDVQDTSVEAVPTVVRLIISSHVIVEADGAS